MLCKTEWSWELWTWSHKMNLLDTLLTSPHYFCWKWIGATNENSNFDLRVWVNTNWPNPQAWLRALCEVLMLAKIKRRPKGNKICIFNQLILVFFIFICCSCPHVLQWEEKKFWMFTVKMCLFCDLCIYQRNFAGGGGGKGIANFKWTELSFITDNIGSFVSII